MNLNESIVKDATYDNSYDTLLPKYLSGDIRVVNDEEEVASV